MRIYSKKTLDEFGRTHADVATALNSWHQVAKSASCYLYQICSNSR